MRIIKFRAWNKKSKRWDNSNIYLDSNGTPWWIFGGELTGNDVDVDIQQFTGLTDKNGVEIFEGDIVKREYGVGYETDRYPSYPKVTQKIVTHPVEYAKFGFNFIDPLDDNFQVTYEVIGNIYENPNLLTKTY